LAPAQQLVVGVEVLARAQLARRSLTSAIWSRNHGSMPVSSWTRSTSAPRQRLLTARSRPRAGGARAASQLVVVDVDRGPAPNPRPVLERAQRLLSASLKVRPIAIASPTDFIVVVSVVVGCRELLEGEPRDLDDDVVERRLEAGRVSRVMSLGISSRV
jgi:hypothetical protein